MDGTDDNSATDGASAVKRRRVLKAAGKTAGAAAALGTTAVGSASARGGKGIRWVAFCGCEEFCIEYRRYDDEGELTALAYRADDCTVYYKAGPNVYEHRHTRRDDLPWEVIETGYAGREDPVASWTATDPQAPCQLFDDVGGPKLDTDEIESYEYDCPR